MKIKIIEEKKSFNILKKKIGNGKIFITGFHGVGAVGFLVSKYLTMQENVRHLGYIFLKHMPMIVRMEGNRIGLPFELYEWDKYVILLNESIPEPYNIHYFCRKIADWVVENGFEMSVLFGGLAEKPKDSSEIRIAYTNKFKEKMKPFATELDKRLAIIGPLALLLTRFEEKNFPAVTILSYARIYEYDLKAAYNAIKLFKDIFKAPIDLSKIEKDIKTEMKIEHEILKEIEKFKQTSPESKIFYM